MSKNIVIFSDGTGQAGGLRPDQRLSNVYKLYRASRPGPDTPIDPAQQVAFYDAGLGSDEVRGALPLRIYRYVRKAASSIAGTGISRNIVDGYAAILKHYEPGDRIYLFGFSRGAYTVRCIANVLSLCGVPTRGVDGGPIPRSGRALRAIATEAVRDVYEHGSRFSDAEARVEREVKASRFRAQYGSDANGQSNVVPYFIGVFDTVAALGLSGPLRLLVLGGITVAFIALDAIVAWTVSVQAARWVVLSVLLLAAVGVLAYMVGRLRVIRDYPSPGASRIRYSSGLSPSYDLKLDTRVRYAKHALAIDESRRDFARVGWGLRVTAQARAIDDPLWFEQLWFAGCHSDVGGSYDEDESRLSDIALGWMIEKATQVPDPILLDRSKLHLFPSPAGMQHCEIEAQRDWYWPWVPGWLRRSWPAELRREASKGTLHPSVIERFRVQGVSQCGRLAPYRPPTLRDHEQTRSFYEDCEKSDSSDPKHESRSRAPRR